MKVTDWFPKRVKPVRKGVYETYDFELEDKFYNYFDGEKWHYGSDNSDSAILCVPSPHRIDHRFKWRGLTRKAMK